MKSVGAKMECMCANERERGGMLGLQGVEVVNVNEFKYLRSSVQSNGECCSSWRKCVVLGICS